MAAPGDIVYPTLAQLRSIGTWVQMAGRVWGMDYRNPSDQYDLLMSNVLSFSIVKASAIANHIDSKDLTIEQRVPPLNRSSNTDDCDFPALTYTRRTPVGIYGPDDALGNEDWVGSGGVNSPNAQGYFTVTGAGSLSLTLPSSYETRLDDIPLLRAPEGCPLGYMYRRANVFYPNYGENEAVYCWLGFERLLLYLTAPEACTLTARLTFRTYTFNDNHLSDSSRQTEFSWNYEEKTVTYNVSIRAGENAAPITLITPEEGYYPALERVVSITLSGFANGNWRIQEPKLASANTGDDPQATKWKLKTYEGAEERYICGGGSIHADAAFKFYDASDDNAGHRLHEWVVKNFDYVEGAQSGLDLTTAWTLSQWATILSNVGEAIDASINTAAYNEALIDDEENQLSILWSFNVCFPNCEEPERPLEQSPEEGTANCALRARTWTICSGIKYLLRTDKVVDGAIHGRSLIEGELFRRAIPIGMIYRLDGNEWAPIGPGEGDECGHWHSPSLREFKDEDNREQYGIIEEEGMENVGSVYTREYKEHDITYVQRSITIAREGTGSLFYAYIVNGALWARWRGHYRKPWSYTALINQASTWVRASICPLPNGWVCIHATTNNGNGTLFRSRNRGHNWESIMGLADDLTNVDLATFAGTLYAIGYDDSAAWFEWSSDFGSTKRTFKDNTTRKRIANASASDILSIEVLPTGELEVAVGGVLYHSNNGGENWSAV